VVYMQLMVLLLSTRVTVPCTVEMGGLQITIWLMRFACWIPKATNTHSEYVILIAFPLQQWLHNGASLLRHTFNDCLCTSTITYKTMG